MKKLSPAQVRKIQALRRNGIMPNDLASRFGVSASRVFDILSNRNTSVAAYAKCERMEPYGKHLSSFPASGK